MDTFDFRAKASDTGHSPVDRFKGRLSARKGALEGLDVPQERLQSLIPWRSESTSSMPLPMLQNTPAQAPGDLDDLDSEACFARYQKALAAVRQ